MEKKEKEQALLVFAFCGESESEAEARKKELQELVRACGGEVRVFVVQHLPALNPRTIVGSGKLEEIATLCTEQDIDLVVFEQELTGSQMKNITDALPVRVLDRLDVILDIFALRASSKKAKLQVRLAQLEYRLPRLRGLGAQLSRTGGGIGTRGPGEQKLETDRRTILREISSVKAQLREIGAQQEVSAKKRQRSALPIVSLAGYTNAGKSTILNGLVELYGAEGKQVYADDLLFATLDLSTRRIEVPGEPPFLLADTVGFIRDLPKKLLSAFESTLQGLDEADLILVVTDRSNPDAVEQLKATRAILDQRKLTAKRLYVMNKSDLGGDPLRVDASMQLELNARDRESLSLLTGRIHQELFGPVVETTRIFSYSQMGLLSEYQRRGCILEQEHTAEGIRTRMRLREAELEREWRG
ncbi:MAG: GTPase HflX [Ndongobacter sp.]|nr:GTPase HflX [Ndongobacter sp.]